MKTPAPMAGAWRLIDYLSSMSLRKVSGEVPGRAQACFIDSIGVGLFGALQPWSRMLAENTMLESMQGACTVLGHRASLSPAPAALVNGTAIHGFELDDLIAEATAHPGAVVVPAALAAAQHSDASGSRLVLGIIAGYEMVNRLGKALGADPSVRGFHLTGIVGPVAAAIAAGVTMNMRPEMLMSAVGLACSTSAGIKSFVHGEGGVVKRLHAGRSAEAGVRMCQLAARGFAGPGTALDGKFGLLEVFAGATARPEQLTVDMGERWAVHDVWTKVYPVCGQIQGIVQAVLQLRGWQPLERSAVSAIRVGVCRYASTNNGNAAPLDTMGAQYSIPFCAAAAALRDPMDPRSYDARSLADEALRDLARGVAIHVDPRAEAAFPRKFAAHVELELTSGEKRDAWVFDPHGSPADPCSDAERHHKFDLLAGASLSSARAGEALDLMTRLSELESLEALTRTLTADRPRA